MPTNGISTFKRIFFLQKYKKAICKTLHVLKILPAIITVTLVINGCTIKRSVPPPSHPRPAPSYPAPGKSPYPAPPVPAPIPAPQPSPPKEPAGVYKPKTGPAGALYATAQEALGRGNYQQAEMAMERALRIEPRNSHYWYTMAQVKYKQGQYSQAIHFCSKSKSLAGKNAQILHLNDDLIQRAQQQLSQ
jgi:tetratricopeptide (TPR) repeat protein